MIAIIAVVIAVIVAAGFGTFMVLGNGGDGEGTPQALSQSEAETVAGQALATLGSNMDAEDGGDLRLIRGSFGFEDEDFMGSGTLDFEMEWGKNGATRFLMDLQSSGGYSIGLRSETFCGGAFDVVVYGNEVYESRPTEDRSMCTGGALSDESEGPGFLGEEFTEDSNNLTVTPNANGTVTATFSDEDGTYTALIDDKGRVQSMTIESPQGAGTMHFDYGSPKTLTPPTATGRAPSSVDGFCWFFDGECEYEAEAGNDAPLSDFEVRVYHSGFDPEDQPAAVFAMDGGTQTFEEFSFILREDGNGQFGAGDVLLIRAPSDEYELVVWDLWADRDVQDDPRIPGPGLAWLLVGLGAALFVRRRT